MVLLFVLGGRGVLVVENCHTQRQDVREIYNLPSFVRPSYPTKIGNKKFQILLLILQGNPICKYIRNKRLLHYIHTIQQINKNTKIKILATYSKNMEYNKYTYFKQYVIIHVPLEMFVIPLKVEQMTKAVGTLSEI